MSDRRLRELERRFRDTGSLEDEAAWLAERVRTRELRASRLHLCALLAHEASRLALSEEQERATDFADWLARLTQFGREAAIRVALAFGRATEADPVSEAVLDAWIRSPSPVHQEAARQRAEGASPLWRELLCAVGYRDLSRIPRAIYFMDSSEAVRDALRVSVRDEVVPWALRTEPSEPGGFSSAPGSGGTPSVG
jgi:hypothetical protein